MSSQHSVNVVSLFNDPTNRAFEKIGNLFVRIKLMFDNDVTTITMVPPLKETDEINSLPRASRNKEFEFIGVTVFSDEKDAMIKEFITLCQSVFIDDNGMKTDVVEKFNTAGKFGLHIKYKTYSPRINDIAIQQANDEDYMVPYVSYDNYNIVFAERVPCL